MPPGIICRTQRQRLAAALVRSLSRGPAVTEAGPAPSEAMRAQSMAMPPLQNGIWRIHWFFETFSARPVPGTVVRERWPGCSFYTKRRRTDRTAQRAAVASDDGRNCAAAQAIGRSAVAHDPGHHDDRAGPGARTTAPGTAADRSQHALFHNRWDRGFGRRRAGGAGRAEARGGERAGLVRAFGRPVPLTGHQGRFAFDNEGGAGVWLEPSR